MRIVFVGMFFLFSLACTGESVPSSVTTLPVLTEAQELKIGPPQAEGADCSETGSAGCRSGRCLKVEPGFPGRHVCTKACGADGVTCARGWVCRKVRAGEDGSFCVPGYDSLPVVDGGGAALVARVRPDGGLRP